MATFTSRDAVGSAAKKNHSAPPSECPTSVISSRSKCSTRVLRSLANVWRPADHQPADPGRADHVLQWIEVRRREDAKLRAANEMLKDSFLVREMKQPSRQAGSDRKSENSSMQ